MKNWKQYTALTLIMMTGLCKINLYSQVTIGSDEAPIKTSLLQLKDQDADESNITSKTGGLLLPRTSLVDPTTLQPFAQPDENNYDSYKRESVGLLVYNVAKSEKFSPGIHYWDGEKWIIIEPSGKNPGEPEDPDTPIEDVNDPKALKMPNSYIIPPGKSLIFKTIKCHAVWTHHLSCDSLYLDGVHEPVLLWQSKKNLIKSVGLLDGSRGAQTKIKVETNELNGNALIGLKINNNIMWSWHIWITGYNPSEPGATYENNGYTIMDRNMGALYTNKNNIFSMGMMYQWGRKDPFPGLGSINEEGNEREFYNINNEVIYVSKETASDGDIIEFSTHNPLTFIKHEGNWMGLSNKNTNCYWGNNKEKGIMDPCPRGWRVPVGEEVWAGRELDTKYVDNMGLDWSSCKGGFYPTAGYRDPKTGNLYLLSENERCGYNWTSQIHEYETSPKSLYFRNNDIRFKRTPKAMGAPVRCVRCLEE